MKQSIRNVFLIVLAAILLVSFAACKTGPDNENGDNLLQIETIKILPKAYINEPYDLWEILIPEDGVEYSATACYTEVTLNAETNEYDFVEKTLEVEDLYFTPVTLENTIVTLQAKRGKETATKIVSIGTTVRADPLDDLYKSTGILGWAEAGISKSVCNDSRYIKGENSATSLHVKFDGMDPHEWGQNFMELSNETAQRYFTDQIWSNAIVTFWVYNPMDQDIEFQLTINDSNHPVMTDWTAEEGHFRRQFAKAGEWTQLFFSLRRMGTTHKLINNQFSAETLNVKFRYNGFSTTQTYQFEFYLDNLDVVPAETYPDIDTTYVFTDETLEQGWENMSQDTGWQGATTIYDYENMMGDGSECSLYATFDSDKAQENPFVVLSPEMMLGTTYMSALPDMTGGTLTGFFKFENCTPEVKVDLIKVVNNDWKFSNALPMQLTAVGDGWYIGTLNVNDFDFGTDRNDGIVRIRFTFSGISKASKVWIDTLKFEYEDAVKVRETADKDWINLPLDSGMTSATVKFSTAYKKAENSVHALQIMAPSGESGVLTLAPEYAVMEGLMSKLPDMTTGTVHAYFYFGDQTPEAAMRLYNSQWKYCQDVKFVFEDAGNGWYYGSIPASLFQGYPEGNSSAIIRISILIPASYTVYMDGLMHDPEEEYKTELNPEDVFNSGIFTTTGFAGKSGAEQTDDGVHIWAEDKTGWPSVGVSFAAPVDISAYTELSLKVKAVDAHKWLGVKIGYLDENGTEQFAELGVDFEGDDWQIVKVRLNQFAGADLTKVTKILIGVNLEDSFHEDECNEFWLKDLQLIKIEAEPGMRGQAFKGGENVFIVLEEADYESISFEYKLTSEGTMSLILRDGTWLKYFGDFTFDANGEAVDFAGITTKKLKDGYIRVTMVMDELMRSGVVDNRDNAPETIGIFDIYSTTTANGYVDKIKGVLDDGIPSKPTEPVDPEKPFNPEDIFNSGIFTTHGFTGNSGAEKKDGGVYIWAESKTGWPTTGVQFSDTADISAYTDMYLDVKAENAHKWLSVKLGYLDDSGAEQYAEVGVDFMEDGWQTVKVSLNQFAGADLTKVTKILICVNLEDSFHEGECNEFWLDNLKVKKTEAEPGMRGQAFKGGENMFIVLEEADYASISFEYKLTSEGTMSLILRDGTWLKYFGDFTFDANGEAFDYAGITTKKLKDGYIRVTMTMDELMRSGVMDNRDNAPETISIFDIYGTTTADGYVDKIKGVLDDGIPSKPTEPTEPVDPEKPFNPEDIFNSGIFTTHGFTGNSGAEKKDGGVYIWADSRTGWPTAGVQFSDAADISAYTDMYLDVKTENAHKWLSVKLGYLDDSGAEQYAEVGVDFMEDDWQTVKVSLNQFAGADLTKVTKILICVNLEDSFHEGECNEFWLDNLKVKKTEAEPGMRGQAFKGGENMFIVLEEADYASISFEYRLTTDGTMSLILRDGTWLKYFGDFTFDANGEAVDFAGITTEKLDDGYIRVTMTMDELMRSGVMDNRDNAPETISIFDIYGTTTADGYVDKIQGVLDENEPTEPTTPIEPTDPTEPTDPDEQEGLELNFTAGAGGFLMVEEAAYKAVRFDYKLESAGEMYVILRDGSWLKYFGDYGFNADGFMYSDLPGVYTEKLDNGYIRVTMILDELNRTGLENNRNIAPETIAVFDVYSITTADGHIENIELLIEVPERPEEPTEPETTEPETTEPETAEPETTEPETTEPETTEPAGLELNFTAGAGGALAVEPGAFDEIRFEYKLESNGEMYVVLRDATWLNYFGDYGFNADGFVYSDLPGVTTEKLDDGYIRVVMKVSELTRSGCVNNLDIAPETIAVFDVLGWTTVNGHIRNIEMITAPQEKFTLDFTSGAGGALAVEPAAYKVIRFDYKLDTAGELYLILRDASWLKYYGDYAFNADGFMYGNLPGVYTEKLDNGYIRVTMIVEQLTRSGCVDNLNNAPETIAVFDVYSWTTADGHIENLEFLMEMPVQRSAKLIFRKPRWAKLPEPEQDTQ